MSNNKKGGAIIVVLVFAGIFVIGVGALLQFVLQQSQSGRGKEVKEKAMQLAEAGLEYYKWHLAHNPDSEWSGTIEYQDPQSNARVGEFIITTTVNRQCGEIMTRDISVEGRVDEDTRFTRTISARYMYPSVANYSYLIDSDVWAGSSRTITGPYYSGGGIRMDATHNSIVTSGVSTWTCDGSFGCSPTVSKAGVWGVGSNPELWQYPAASTIDFANIQVDYADLKSKSQSDGHYFSSVSNGVGDRGYHIIFKSDGTFDMYRVDSASYNWGWDSSGSAHRDYHTITSESFIGNYTIPSDCSLLFIEDQVWLEGVVSGRVTLVAADIVNNYDPNIILHNNLTYATGADVDGITIIGEHDITISAKSPEYLTLNGIFVADSGKFGRYHYVENPGYYWDYGIWNWVYAYGVGTTQDLETLTINGTVVSSERTGTSWGYWIYRWGYGWIEEDSGFANRVNSYERVQAFNPPPFAPSASTIPYMVNWREE